MQSQNADLLQLIEQACLHVDFAITYVNLKHQKLSEGKKFTIQECTDLLKDFTKKKKHENAYVVIKLRDTLQKYDMFKNSYRDYLDFKERLLEEGQDSDKGIAR